MIMHFDNLKDLLVFNIKYYRYLNNLSPEKLSDLCGLSTKYLTDIERGLHCPTILKIDALAKALEVEPYVLFQNPKRDKDIINRMNSSRQYNQSNK